MAEFCGLQNRNHVTVDHMLGRTEARMGQLLGEPKHGVHTREYEHVERDGDRLDFRILARVLNGECPLTDDEWRISRRAPPQLGPYGGELRETP